ncbi:MAG: sugar transferase [Chitinivibrionales bacterium]|nr:sugar transferase [Chitinivibrionales bacterium]
MYYKFAAKRTCDIIISAFGLFILSGPFALIALIVKLSSKGPVFYKQLRVGRYGKCFYIYKFRSMYIDSDIKGSITSSRDARITSAGRILRKLKLDELPQLWNVLVGEMSFVGPRPDVRGYADALEGEDRIILDFLPGITGPATLCFRNEEKLLSQAENVQDFNDNYLWPRKVSLNRKYCQNWSFGKDLGYILITFLPFLNCILHLVPQQDNIEPKND